MLDAGRYTNQKQCVNKKQLLATFKLKNPEVDSLASSGDQAKYMKYVSFPLPLLEAALSIFNFTSFVKKRF
jgi:hypothetical protein